MGGDRTTRADVVPGASPSVSNPNAQAWFNPAAFSLQSTPYGTVGRDTIWVQASSNGTSVLPGSLLLPSGATSSSAVSCSTRSTR
jgi:hypothetical protein